MVDAGISYRRDFIILEEEGDTFRADMQKSLTGYVKVEDRGIKSKISVYIQNIKAGNYIALCICARDGKVEGVQCGNITVDKSDKADVMFETMSKDMFSSKCEINDVVGLCIVSTKKSKVLEGFKSQKYQYILNQVDTEKEKREEDHDQKPSHDKKDCEYENEDKFQNEYDSKINKLSIGNEYKKKEETHNDDHHEHDEHNDHNDDHHEHDEHNDHNDDHNDHDDHNDYDDHSNHHEHSDEHHDEHDEMHKKDNGHEETKCEHNKEPEYRKSKKEELRDLIFETNPGSGDLDNTFIPFQNANTRAKWKRRRLDRIPNHYVRRVLSIPYIYNMVYLYGHYIIGETDEYFIIGIPGRFSDSHRYMTRYNNIAEWVRMSDTLRNYGYWMFVIDKNMGDIIYLE